MALTQAEFLTVVDATAPDSVNIWYSDTTPLTVFGLTVPVVDNTGLSTIELLQSAQQINLTINGYNYTFNILDRAERTVQFAGQNTTYYLFNIQDQIIDSLADDTAILPGQVLFVIPGFQNTNFFGGDYDALINNVENSRQSSNIMTSDRYKITGGPGSLNPLNIDELRNLTAERADVQDSNYSTTGWINGRYEGTSTDSTTFGGIDSAITGKSFEGSFYPSGIPTSSINQQISSSAVIFTEYLSTSQEDLPTTASIEYTRYKTVASSIAASDTQIQVTISNFPALLDISIGDIIVIHDSSEYMRVDNIQPFLSNLMLTVTRRWNGSPTGTYNIGNLDIKKIKNLTKIYQLQGNKVQGIQKGQLVIRESQEILPIDRLGQVVVV